MSLKVNKINWSFSIKYIIPILVMILGFYLLSTQFETQNPIFWPWAIITIGIIWLAVEFKKTNIPHNLKK
ncbi:MAG: hypothetical protein CMH64_04580 [Nanoarchaeota archaeon]|nr:hypothetical protein [Nanoarchaeota archaeon]